MTDVQDITTKEVALVRLVEVFASKSVGRKE